MANKTLFQTIRGALLPRTDTVNHEGAPAYMRSPKQALAQYAATGCLNQTFYASAKEQLDNVLSLASQVDPEFVAKVAIYSRERALLKDMPALLCASLSVRDAKLHEQVFTRVIDNGRMLRNYVQILRSGVVGRKSLGSAPKRLVREWLETQEDETLFRATVGQSPSLADVVKMVHPKPVNANRAAFYGYLIGRSYNGSALPALVQHFERFKSGDDLAVPDLPFTMLSSMPLSEADWAEIAVKASWQTTRMNLNTFARHGVFAREGMTARIAARLRDPEQIRRARVFPYQLLAASLMADANVPNEIREALREAMEIATANVPAIQGQIYVCPDVSGSMRGPVTGYRTGSTTAVRCVDVAALVTAAIVRQNPSARVIPFEQDVVPVAIDAQAGILANAEALAAIGGGGTNCSAPLRLLNRERAKGDLVVLVSDNESWVDANHGRGTALLAEWQRFQERNPNARLVCLDLTPNTSTQAPDRPDILNIGGFSDEVFTILREFAAGQLQDDHWVGVIEAVTL